MMAADFSTPGVAKPRNLAGASKMSSGRWHRTRDWLRSYRVILLGGVKARDALECLGGDRCRARSRQFEEGTADVRPAKGKLHVVALGQGPVAGSPADLTPEAYQIHTLKA